MAASLFPTGRSGVYKIKTCGLGDGVDGNTGAAGERNVAF
jgi:hypothetical protein